MDIDKLNIQVKSGERAKASDFNKTTAKVDEIIELLISGGISGSGGVFKKYTQKEYTTLKNADRLENTFYTIYESDELKRVYLGDVLVMRKKTEGEETTIGSVFPIVFPIIFA